MQIEYAYKIYAKEFMPINRPGLYSGFDGEVLYSIVREKKPKVILDFAPREGRTTSYIISALLKNYQEFDKIIHIICEKDLGYLEDVKSWTAQFQQQITFVYFENILECLNELKNYSIDFLCIDANHDFILADWYVENLFPLVAKTGFIHVHDVMYDLSGSGLNDIGFTINPQTHPDIVDHTTLIELYGTKLHTEACQKYLVGSTIELYEEDILKQWYSKQDLYQIESTISLHRKLHGNSGDFVRTAYFFRREK
jgi:hypothetical protein